jgi:hypothetical protein
MNRFLENLKAQAEANPLVAVGIAATLLHGAAKLMEANTQRTYAKAHVKEIDRRVAQSLK